MPPIRCRYSDCLNIEEGFCAAGSIELDPEDGCLTYEPTGEIQVADWGDDEAFDDYWDDDDDDSIAYQDDDGDGWSSDELLN